MDSSWYQPIDVPLVLFNTELLKAMFASIQYSMRSIGTIGVLGLGVVLSAGLIVRYFNAHFLHNLKLFEKTKQNEFKREVFAEDFKRNTESIIENGILKRQINHYVNERWRKNFKQWDVDDAVYRKEVNHEANYQYGLRHENWEVGDVVYRRGISSKARERYRELLRNRKVAKAYYQERSEEE